MAEVCAISGSNTVQRCDGIMAPITATNSTADVSLWNKEKELIEAVAKYLPKNPDGTLDIKTARGFTILDLLERSTSVLVSLTEAKTPEEKKQLEEEYKAFDNLLQKREEDDTKKRENIFN